ncbi:uncharacterized protein V2V93DRAFT_358651 [Kockiozyma suomiensis]|uniref:uncharacterized protein n=1 Tax=Kockiozyma suomiensis TaxID=1337062 RepID=UPI0033434424
MTVDEGCLRPEIGGCRLLELPFEILAHILSKVDGRTLIAVAATCRRLHSLLFDRDDIWRSAISPIIRPSIPTSSPMTCAPYKSYRDLFTQLLPFTWFDPGIWHGNRDLHGSIYVSRYNPQSGHLESHELFCVYDRQDDAPQTEWSINPSVVIQNFSPRIEKSQAAILKFTPATQYDKNHEVPQPLSPRGMATSFMHAVSISPERVVYPQMNLWPPLHIPAAERTRNDSPTGFRGQIVKRSDSKNLFRLRRWISFVHADAFGVIMGERVETIARVLPELYTPSAEYPLRGIWIGDYESHGGEFILFHQPQQDKNRLEAIKLTGDPNVPRGEFTFVVDDLSHVERVATETEWPGARIVAAQGHTAALNFMNSTFSPTQLIIINENMVAHYWINLYRIKVYRRVDVADLLAGGNGAM